MISYALWQRRFGRAAGVAGEPLLVDGVPVTIVGVTPQTFFGVDVGRAFDVALPLETEPLIHGNHSTLRMSPLLVMLRLKPGQSAKAGTAILRSVQPAILGVTPQEMSTVRPHYREPFTLVSAATGTSLPVRGPTGLRQAYARPLFTILVVVLLVLVIAAVNIANLLLARATARRHELSVRLALGAPRIRLARQLLIESLVLAAFGAIGGLIVGAWGSRALVAQLATPIDRITLDLSLDWRVLTFTAIAAVATAGIFGMVPALRATRGVPMDVLRMQGRTASQDTAGAGRFFSLSSGLVIVQIGLSLALVIAAALFVRSFARLSDVPLGFDADRLLVANVDMQRARTNLADRTLLYQRIVDAAASVPGVAHAGGSIWTPVDGGMRMGDSQSRVEFNFVTPGWFAAYGTGVRTGRDFSVRDTAGAPPVVVVNEAFARALMPGRSPVGETIPYPRSREGEVQRTIVGIVGDTVFDSQREGIQPIVYLPVAQAGIEPGNLTEISVGVRPAAGSPMQIARSVGAAIIGVDPGLSFTFRPMTDHVDGSVRRERLVAALSELFGALALVIAALGLYGVTSYTVNRRFSEIGIRMALGAQRGQVFGLILGHSLTLTSVGIALGLAGATATTRYVRGMLFGITPLDPSTFIAVAVMFAIVAATAAAIPAHRATKVDPLVALRTD